MESDDAAAQQRRVSQRRDLVEFEIVPVSPPRFFREPFLPAGEVRARPATQRTRPPADSVAPVPIGRGPQSDGPPAVAGPAGVLESAAASPASHCSSGKPAGPG